MSDPVSVAGTAVGVVSLGIQVCKSLVSYLRSLEGRDQEIKAGLAEVETIVSIFYSLNGILPKVNESTLESTTIRRCLRDSEMKLLEFQQFLIKLRGPQSALSSTIERMDDVRRLLIHPLRAGKLKSLHQSLQELLNNLNVATGLVSLESVLVTHDKVDKLQASALGLESQICQHSDQLQSLKHGINNNLNNVDGKISQTESHIQDLNGNIDAKLTLMGNAVGSIATSNQRLEEAFAELLKKAEFRSGSLISQIVRSNPSRRYPLS
ncbi:hypothetical protein FSARC_8766 [Fusarium sarcochroum]|uniref:Fungal N-terminal domain-containing protein n=1 Tax=Fusarium sarcochroum TaxID=1208366 RepID=A0A8H4TSI5_9HYPO|nr:hypothetical protein FSARC_8766 [Fusarium sarcochroum]